MALGQFGRLHLPALRQALARHADGGGRIDRKKAALLRLQVFEGTRADLVGGQLESPVTAAKVTGNSKAASG